MLKKNIVVQLQYGLQARCATEFVQKAHSFESDILVIKNDRALAGKSIMGVMSLAIRKGEEVTLIAEGKDEHVAIATLENFLLCKVL